MGFTHNLYQGGTQGTKKSLGLSLGLGFPEVNHFSEPQFPDLYNEGLVWMSLMYWTTTPPEGSRSNQGHLGDKVSIWERAAFSLLPRRGQRTAVRVLQCEVSTLSRGRALFWVPTGGISNLSVSPSSSIQQVQHGLSFPVENVHLSGPRPSHLQASFHPPFPITSISEQRGLSPALQANAPSWPSSWPLVLQWSTRTSLSSISLGTTSRFGYI